MIKYKRGEDVGALEPWPFDAPESRYRMLDGTPAASGRLDAGGPGDVTRFGIWRCTPGSFACIEQGDELMTVLAGRCTLINHSAADASVTLAPGDSLFIRDQSHVTWIIHDEITKVFHGFKPEGY